MWAPIFYTTFKLKYLDVLGIMFSFLWNVLVDSWQECKWSNAGFDWFDKINGDSDIILGSDKYETSGKMERLDRPFFPAL